MAEVDNDWIYGDDPELAEDIRLINTAGDIVRRADKASGGVIGRIFGGAGYLKRLHDRAAQLADTAVTNYNTNPMNIRLPSILGIYNEARKTNENNRVVTDPFRNKSRMSFMGKIRLMNSIGEHFGKNNVYSKLEDMIAKNRENPDIPSRTELNRSVIDADKLSEDDLIRAGMFKSYIAVPELGQSQIATWRHPFSGLHIHKHGDKWVYHEDTYKSFASQLQTYKMLRRAGIKPKITAKKLLEGTLQGTNHLLQEGFPGYVQFINGAMLGGRGFMERLEPDTRTLSQRVPRALLGLGAGTAAISALHALKGGKNGHNPHILASAAGVGGFSLGTEAAQALVENLQNSGIIGYMPNMPAALIIMGMAGAGAAGAYAGGRWLEKKVKEWMSKKRGKAPAPESAEDASQIK